MISKDSDGSTALLYDKGSDTTVLIIGCYLAPESSVYGRQIQQSFENITNILFEQTDVGFTVIWET